MRWPDFTRHHAQDSFSHAWYNSQRGPEDLISAPASGTHRNTAGNSVVPGGSKHAQLDLVGFSKSPTEYLTLLVNSYIRYFFEILNGEEAVKYFESVQ